MTTTPAPQDLVRVLQLLRDLAAARTDLAFMNDHRVPAKERLRRLAAPDAQHAVWLLFYAVDQMLAGGGAGMEA